MSNTLPALPYPYDALEPYISQQIMTLHHTKHHQTYVNALNTAEEKYAQAATPKERIALQAALKFNGGGHINHSLFWKNLAPAHAKGGSGGVLKDGPLKAAIDKDFGGLDNLKKEFNAATLGIQGSGWGWLVRHAPHSSPAYILMTTALCRVSTRPPSASRSSPPRTRTRSSRTSPSSASTSGSTRSTCSI
ncbi:Iron/manganese superoxide dismutase [Mycena albidolilacea]|uniref:Superoxide dismutase n=1 Tax=Mycena albidolilacea TaxID=1033008 RepID=A0AAD6YZR5_9AGAR|nr:Iron/manganese superoxide dismutase [Mycena albidolilacea]